MKFCPYCSSAIYDDAATACPECGRCLEEHKCPRCGRPVQPGQTCLYCADRNFDVKPRRSGELTTWHYMGLILLSMVPVIGFIFMVLWACGVGDNLQRTRFARGMLLAKAVMFVFSIVMTILSITALMPALNELEQWVTELPNNHEYYEFYSGVPKSAAAFEEFAEEFAEGTDL